MRDFATLKARVSLAAIIGAYVKLKKVGSEYSGCCPFHPDSTPSFRVYPDHWHCYGCNERGDVFDFLVKQEGIDLDGAFDLVNSGKFAPVAPVTVAAKKKDAEWTSFRPPPEDNRPKSFVLPELGEPTHTWAYLHGDGGVLGWVARYPLKDSKTFRQWTWGRLDTQPGKACKWAPRHFSRPRPLYGLDRLAQAPAERQVLVVEGEKAADAAQLLFPAVVVMSWPGGSNAVSLADWTPIYGRRVMVVPDNDQPGRAAAEWLCKVLHSNKSRVVLIDPEPTLPPHWDLADALAENWTTQHALKWARERKREWPLAAVEGEPAPEGAPTPTTPGRPSLAVVGGTDADGAPTKAPLPEIAKFSDRQMAGRFIFLHGHNWRYTEEEGLWRHWTGKVWAPDRTRSVMHVTGECLSSTARADDASTLSAAQVDKLESDAKAASVARTVSYHPTIAVPLSQWDQDDYVLATPGGVVDLRTGELREATRVDYCTRLAGCAPAPKDTPAPMFAEWLGNVTRGDTDLAEFLQRWAGYCLTGSYADQQFVYLYGAGGNGKGVFCRLLQGILGEYASVPMMTEFTETLTTSHSTELYSILLSRAAIVDEGKQNQRMDAAKVKWLTGGTTISARQMRENPVQIKPKCKLTFQSNYKPSLRAVDDGIRRRFNLVPFGYKIPRIDPTFEDRLHRELPAILRWAIDGCLKWQASGLTKPQAIVDATADYMRTEDIIGSWMDDCTVLEPVARSLYTEVYASYASYCERANERPWPAKRFKEAVIARGLELVKVGAVNWLEGIKFTDAEAARVAAPTKGAWGSLDDF